MDGIGYCENADCPVVVFVYDPATESANCPHCGRFGRLKDKNPNEEDKA